jgi:hypothetical protein
VVVVVGPVVVVGAVVVVVGSLVVVVDEPVVDVVVAVPMPVVVVVGAVVVVVGVVVVVVVAVVVVVVAVVVVAVVVVVDVGGTVGPGAPPGEGNAGRTMTGLVAGTEVVVVAGAVVEVVDVVAPAEPSAGLDLEVVPPPASPGPATVKATLRVNDDVLLRARRAKATLRSLAPALLPMRTRAEYLPVAHLLGLCEYTTNKDG